MNFPAAAERTITIERLAWATAYLAHFAEQQPAAVLQALGLSDTQFGSAQRALVAAMSTALRSGDIEPSTRFATELSLAKGYLREQNPTLDDVRTTYGRAAEARRESAPGSVDETAIMRAFLPNVVLPFSQGEAAKPFPEQISVSHISLPVEHSISDLDSTAIADPNLQSAQALPFQPFALKTVFDPDLSLPIPPPKKPE